MAAVIGQRQSLYQALLEGDVVLSREERFDKAGFTVALVDEFYEELRREVPARIEVKRPDSSRVFLQVAGHAN